MTIPPFPSQDLAKLVLGYLAEEQLMTAYDEFLQASPYLDAMRNEYDRIFMTSLRNILAEYRAIKIYVETCKPFSLRRRLFQCANLLDIVKLLVTHIDVNKLHGSENDKTCTEKLVINSPSKLSGCDACNVLKLPNCACKSRQSSLNVSGSNECETQSGANTSVEATSLADLPGSYLTHRKKHVKVLERCSSLNSSANIDQPINIPNISECTQYHINESNIGNKINYNTKEIETRGHKESNNGSKPISNENIVQRHTYNNITDSDNVIKTVSNASTFQDFAAGVTAGVEVQNNIVPDSSTSESSCVPMPMQTDVNAIVNDIKNIKQQFLLKISSIRQNNETKRNEAISVNKLTYPRIRPKSEDPKIKILSDVKVDHYNDSQKKISANNATSTPLMQMQTIVINGTPAYRHEPVTAQRQNFTKAEIMAMPTLIVVPPSSAPTILSQTSQCSMASTAPILSCTQANTKDCILSPLVIDVTSSPCQDNINIPDTIKESSNVKETSVETGLIKTVNVHKNTSLPKDSTVACESSTPQVPPPIRKSSSTPRRNSHIRVLDFTTPRRILHETANEQGDSQNPDCPVEVVLSGCPNVINSSGNAHSNHVTVEITSNDGDNISAKENNGKIKHIKHKKNNWDADLRALVAADTSNISSKSVSFKTKNSKKKKSTLKIIEETDVTGDVSASVSKKKSSSKKTKRKQIIEEEEPEIVTNSKINVVPVKPTINIKPATDWGATSQDSKKDDANNRVNMEDNNETPELERLSLHNDIGAKLNISDIFETPYKQAFYDIQMETPRFLRLGPDLPDEPMSDIKIMNIPTPRFLDTSKPLQATPSSYASRPTDYSSGGSYYKPDDQDYVLNPNIECPVTSRKESAIILPQDIENNKKHSRPVRKCTKNVSYYKKSLQEKEELKEAEVTSNHSDTTSVTSSIDKNESNAELKCAKDLKINPKLKNVPKRKNSVKKRKTPVKKEKPKMFMKIKPRRMTPTKETVGGRGRKRLDDSRKNSPAAKRGKSKEKNNVTPLISLVPTKSRRKSSTPRKLHCSKTFNSESSGHDSPDNVPDVKPNEKENSNNSNQGKTIQLSDTDQLTLRWSDDGSQDAKSNDAQAKTTDIEDVSKIQAYIETTVLENPKPNCEEEGTLQIDLIKRGFDVETAKKIERDLLDTPPHSEISRSSTVKHIEISELKKDETCLERSVETDSSIINGLQIVEETEENYELSVHDCNEETENYIVSKYDETKNVSHIPPVKLKDSYLMEICVDNEATVRLRAPPFIFLVDLNFEETHRDIDKETEAAVNSILKYDKLYTPLKESIKAQCYEIFDSTLTSLDTPLKTQSSPKAVRDMTVTEIVFEEEKPEVKETKKRKRLQNSNSSEESANENKRTKPDPKDLLKSTNIQNFDIETVLTKLHGH
ncbi:hypothetical protein K1T71_005564 [Dendrolimus kikuchii]|uniref:Uncharacterized protein n=1 Tax=Dendrolimus kikuchii TaxID=765133 RepID=A0ACC1D4C7_9NEOP|nr:hypothetical protein K1T71_005564 [Dendrolimus kikuchii]